MPACVELPVQISVGDVTAPLGTLSLTVTADGTPGQDIGTALAALLSAVAAHLTAQAPAADPAMTPADTAAAT
jgi:hypothetical protein